jgi:predicted extracellular nuclease
MSKIFLSIPVLLLFLASPQEQRTVSGAIPEERDLRIMFYNVENFFDINDDSLKADEEFLPEGNKQWDKFRYREKALNIFKAIAAVGERQPPDIVCFAEIENSGVLKELIYNTPLDKIGYRISHFESPDFRGIDVGLIYNPNKIRMLRSYPLRIEFPGEPRKTTRDILCFKALLSNNDTLHLFVNHWPSRRGGEVKSEPYRLFVAEILRTKIDSILGVNACANVVITGDFNDEPLNNSLTRGLKAQTHISEPYHCNHLYNLAARFQDKSGTGTYRFRNNWNMLDQFIVSGSLLRNTVSTWSCPDCMYIAAFDFLLETDEKYGGHKPEHTYLGPSYKGGTSDHLPVYLDFYFNDGRGRD